MRSYRYLQYDVFTDHLFGGNQLAVFLDGRGLSTETMQAIAKEMNFSETTFVLPPEQPANGTDVRMRIFTPANELPAAGRDRFVFGLGVGPVPVSLTWKGDELTFVWMTQMTPTFGAALADKAAAA